MNEEKNIMIAFLSTVNLRRKPAEYKNITSDGREVETKTTNESAVRYLVDAKGIKLDKLFYFATNSVLEPLINEEGFVGNHADYFISRVSKFVDNIEKITVEQKFDDNAEPEAAINYVIEMANKLKKTIEEWLSKGYKIRVHADCTGGMRHANIMTIALLKLLQYSNIEIGYILYSNLNSHKVEEATEVYRIFDLISGAEEFANFGSVNSIDKYIKNADIYNQSEILNNLIKAMDIFANEIRLCHLKKLMDAAKELKKAIEDFMEKTDKYSFYQEKLLLILGQRIQNDYKELLSERLDDIKLIKWCLNHDYLQQALTLYNERLPEILIKSNIITITSNTKEKVKKEWEKDSEGEEFEYWCLVHHESNKEKSIRNLANQKSNKISEFLKELASHMLKSCDDIYQSNHIDLDNLSDRKQKIIDEVKEKFKKYISENKFLSYSSEKRLFNFYFQLIDWSIEPEKYQDEYENNIIVKKLISTTDNNDSFLKKWKKAEGNPLQRVKAIQFFFKTNINKDFFNNNLTKISFDYSNRIIACIEDGEYELHKNINIEDIKDIMKDYKIFKDERNISNHAKLNGDEQFSTAKEFRNAMLNSLEHIEECINNIKGIKNV